MWYQRRQRIFDNFVREKIVLEDNRLDTRGRRSIDWFASISFKAATLCGRMELVLLAFTAATRLTTNPLRCTMIVLACCRWQTAAPTPTAASFFCCLPPPTIS